MSDQVEDLRSIQLALLPERLVLEVFGSFYPVDMGAVHDPINGLDVQDKDGAKGRICRHPMTANGGLSAPVNQCPS